MAVYPNVSPMGSGSVRDWTTEIAPGFAYGGSGGMDRGMAGGMSGGMNHSVSGGMSGGMSQMSGGMDRTAAPAQSGDGAPAVTGNRTGQGGAQDGVNASGGGVSAASGGVGTAVRAGWYPGGGYMDIIGKDIENNLPAVEIGAPDSMEEVFRGSMKALLLRNIGNYVVATFLIGTQGTVSWEGILYDVGNDYLAIYQTGRDQYIVSDLYSLKYVEFYDTRRREMCEAMLNGQTSNWETTQTPDWRQQNAQTPDWRQENAQTPDWRQQNAQTPDWRQQNAQTPDWRQQNAQTPDWRQQNAQSANQGNRQSANRGNSQPTN